MARRNTGSIQKKRAGVFKVTLNLSQMGEGYWYVLKEGKDPELTPPSHTPRSSAPPLAASTGTWSTASARPRGASA